MHRYAISIMDTEWTVRCDAPGIRCFIAALGSWCHFSFLYEGFNIDVESLPKWLDHINLIVYTPIPGLLKTDRKINNKNLSDYTRVRPSVNWAVKLLSRQVIYPSVIRNEITLCPSKNTGRPNATICLIRIWMQDLQTLADCSADWIDAIMLTADLLVGVFTARRQYSHGTTVITSCTTW